jgi:acetyltransferase EpsM
MSRLMLIGGGGFAKEVAEIAELNDHTVVGYVASAPGTIHYPYLGTMERLRELRDHFDIVAIAFGAVDRRSAASRAAVVNWVIDEQFPAKPLVSPRAIRARGASVGDGTVVAHGAVLSVDCAIGAFSIVNTNAIVGHDARVGSNVTLAPAAFVGGDASIDDNTLMGPGTIVLEGRTVGRNVVVGMGATVARDVPPRSTVMPVRARVVRGL